MLNGLDLFSGIGGGALALAPWVRPIAYCEIEAYAQGVLLSRMADGLLPAAPIWPDIRTLRGSMLPEIDIIYGGFPCQDLSVAGRGRGLAGKRSGLVFEIFRLIDEIRPAFVFLENVPAIRTRGAERVVKELASRGYDCRWDTLSAFDVGAPHERQRWWLAAANADGLGLWDGRQRKPKGQAKTNYFLEYDGGKGSLAHAHGLRELEPGRGFGGERGRARDGGQQMARADGICGEVGRDLWQWIADGIGKGWWDVEPPVGRVVDELPQRMDRLKGLGNAWVPTQAREAFRRLMGFP